MNKSIIIGDGNTYDVLYIQRQGMKQEASLISCGPNLYLAEKIMKQVQRPDYATLRIKRR